MADLNVDQLFTPPTEDQVLESYLTDLETLGIPARSWRKAGAFRTILRVVAKLHAIFAVVLVGFIKSGFLETATGAWLTLLALYVYGVSRRTATFASGSLVLDNSDGGGLYDHQAGEVVVRHKVTGKSYVNTEAFVLSPGATLTVAFQAVEQGSASSAVADTITEFVTELEGVTVSNPSAFIAIDDEQDPELRQACRDKIASRSPRGPRGAYAWAVRSATHDDGSPVNLNRWRVSPSSSTGEVYVYVASPSGAPAAEDVAAVEANIETVARPDTVTAYVVAASTVPITRSLVVWAQRTPGVSAADIKAKVEAAFLVAGPQYPLGGLHKPPIAQGYVLGDRIKQIAASAFPTIYDVDGEGDDVALNINDVAVFNVTADVRLVDIEAG